MSIPPKDCFDSDREYNQSYHDQSNYHTVLRDGHGHKKHKFEIEIGSVIRTIHHICDQLSYGEGILGLLYGDPYFARCIAEFVSSDDESMEGLENVVIYLCLPYFSRTNGWTTRDINLLKKHPNIAYYLARVSKFTHWTINDNGILSLQHGRVALELARNSGKTGWTTDGKEILSLHRGGVTFWLSKCHKLSTSDSRILDLVEAYRNQYNKRIASLRKKLLHRGIQNMNNNLSMTKNIHGLNP